MFGLWLTTTGHTWKALSLKVEDFAYRVEHANIMAVPKDYINDWRDC